MPTHALYPTISDQGRITLLSKLSSAIFVHLIPTAAVIVAIWLACTGQVTKLDLLIGVGMYVATGIGVTVGYHRLFTHGAFETYAPVRWLLALLGGTAAEGAPIIWATQHRQHHQFSDESGDPHSPNVLRGPGFLGTLRAFWHSHYGHVFRQIETIRPEQYCPDLAKDPFFRLLEKCAAVPVIIGLLVPAALGY